VRALHARDLGKSQALDVARDGCDGRRIAVHEQARGRAAGESLQAERAGAGEKVDHPQARETRRPGGVFENIEQRLAHAIAGRPRQVSLWRHKGAATKLPGDDPHAIVLWISYALDDERSQMRNRR